MGSLKLKRDKLVRRAVRKFRISKRVKGTPERPRLVFVKSLKHLYAQVIDDSTGKTLIFCSTLKGKEGKNIEAAKSLGGLLGGMAKDKKVDKIVFDRNGYLYHGKVKAFADAVREKGINF